MQAEEGEERVRKDAVFQCPGEPHGIAACEHNGKPLVLLPEFGDQRRASRRSRTTVTRCNGLVATKTR